MRPGADRFLLIMLAGCGGAGPVPSMTASPMASDDRVSEVISAALAADARAEFPDSLYAPEAVIIADGAARTSAPFYAGVGVDGEVAVTSTRMEVGSTTAWALVEYRWLSTREGTAREGRVTLVLSPDTRGAWRIRHAHSSSPPRG